MKICTFTNVRCTHHAHHRDSQTVKSDQILPPSFAAWWFQTALLPADIEGKEIPKKEAGCSRLVGGRFMKQGNLHKKLVLGGYKMSSSPHPPES